MKLIDISHTLNGDTPVYPADFQITLSQRKELETDFYNAYLLQTGLHTGTHIDAPMHFFNDGRTIDSYAIDNFIGKGVLLDVRGENPITLKQQYYDTVQEGSAVLLYTGHDSHYPNASYFDKHPCLDMDFTEFLISKKVKIIGMDIPSPDYSPYAIHKALLSNGIFVLENLTNLGALLDAGEFELIALPLKITAEASIVRAICRVTETANADADLIALAHKARLHAYVPYSKFQVGAALETSSGTIYSGCNIENATYGATICGERTAIVKAVSEGHQSFSRLAIVSSGGDFTYPCGICRQMLVEFSPDCEIILSNDEGKIKKTTARELLPEFFSL